MFLEIFTGPFFKWFQMMYVFIIFNYEYHLRQPCIQRGRVRPETTMHSTWACKTRRCHYFTSSPLANRHCVKHAKDKGVPSHNLEKNTIHLQQQLSTWN